MWLKQYQGTLTYLAERLAADRAALQRLLMSVKRSAGSIERSLAHISESRALLTALDGPRLNREG